MEKPIMMKTYSFFFSVFLLLLFTSFQTGTKTILRNDLKKYYENYSVRGSFVLYDQNKDSYLFYQQEDYKKKYTPASTFKICNSLIGLETGSIKDENEVIKWDGKIRQNQNWNSDQDLKTAFKNSTVWYYQELARRVGGKQMKYWLDKAQYGNADTSGGIDRFWLSGELRISPEEQIRFLKQLHDNLLPFSKRATDIVKNIMIAKDSSGFRVRAKTGWGQENNTDIGWYVGYVETKNNVYYFANCIQTEDENSKDFAKARIEIVYAIFRELDLKNH